MLCPVLFLLSPDNFPTYFCTIRAEAIFSTNICFRIVIKTNQSVGTFPNGKPYLLALAIRRIYASISIQSTRTLWLSSIYIIYIDTYKYPYTLMDIALMVLSVKISVNFL